MTINFKTIALLASISMMGHQAATAQEDYEGGRGLITLEGPTGMFINPTSGTMPKGYATAQYCFFLPNNEPSDVMGHGLIAAYGLADNLEIGAQGSYVDRDKGSSLSGAGPFVRFRVLKDEGKVPEVSVGAYSRFGDDALEKIGGFAAAYKGFAFDGDFFKSLGVHAGARYVELKNTEGFNPYAGLELQLPARLYAVGEYTIADDEPNDPYAYGLQWRAAGVNISVAMIEPGNLDEDSFYFGIGYASKM